MGQVARRRAIVLWLTVAVMTSGCVSRPPTDEADPNGVLTTILNAEPVLDPQIAGFVADVMNIGMVFEPPLRSDPKTLRPVPGAAKALPDVSSDGLTYRLTIRDDSKYSDGTPVRARDFAYAITRLCDPTIKASYASVAYVISGCKEWNQLDPAKDPPEKVRAAREKLTTVGVQASADKELVIRLTQPAAYFSSVLTLWAFSPVRESDVAHGGDQWTEPSTYVGNGPFVLSSWKHSDRLIFTPNPYYRAPPKIKRWTRLIITEPAVALNEYRHNEVDAFAYGSGVAAGTVMQAIEADPTLKKDLTVKPNLCSYAYGFNSRRPPFDDPTVRLAFAKALDREAYVRDVMGGLGTPSTTWIPAGVPGYDRGDVAQAYDPVEAARLVASSRYASTDALRSIVLPVNLQASSRVRAEWARAQWKAHLGVDVRIDQMDGPTMSQLFRTPETIPQISSGLGWCSDYPDQQDWLSLMFRSDSQLGWSRNTGYLDPEFDRLTDQADKETDQARRDEMYQRAQRMLSVQAVIAYVASGQQFSLTKPWVRGITVNPLDDYGALTGGTEKIFVIRH